MALKNENERKNSSGCIRRGTLKIKLWHPNNKALGTVTSSTVECHFSC